MSHLIEGQILTLTAIETNYYGDQAAEITIRANDGGQISDVTISVNILPVNDAPIANEDTYNVEEGGTFVSDVTSGISLTM